MNYTTKPWSVEGFIYDPHDIKPDWFNELELIGKAFEYKNAGNPYLEFEDKRCRHRAYVGDFVHRDQFGRFDVWSGKHLNDRAVKV